MKRIRAILSSLPFLLLLHLPVYAQSSSTCDGHWAVQILFEDDTGLGYFTPFGPGDKYYTAGARTGFSLAPYNAETDPKWADRHLPFSLLKNECHRIGWAAGGNIYTPANLSDPNINKNDRPYAGWAYAAYTLDSYSPDAKRSQFITLNLGSTGPRVGAAGIQDAVHSSRLINAAIPQGWSHQIQNHIGFFAEYRTSRQIWSKDDWFDIGIHAGGTLGNVFTYPDAGGVARLGLHVSRAYRIARASTPAKLSWLSAYIYSRATERLVLRNMFLDGQLVPKPDRYTLDKTLQVNDIEGGAVLRIKAVALLYREVTRSREFAQQPTRHNYGSLTLSIFSTPHPSNFPVE